MKHESVYSLAFDIVLHKMTSELVFIAQHTKRWSQKRAQRMSYIYQKPQNVIHEVEVSYSYTAPN